MTDSPRNLEVSGKPDAEYVQKREANAQRTQAYHSKREEISKFQGNLMQCFHATVMNRETVSRVVFILF